MTTQKAEKNKKQWIKSIQSWSWIITISWMVIANFYKPFGLFGFVCMLTPIVIALSGRGKMHCARVCPRGSFIATFTKKISLHLPKPQFMNTKVFRTGIWAVMMGTFLVLVIIAAPKGVYVFGNTILIFMEVATAIAFLFGILFAPRAWCTVCPMGFTSGNIARKVSKSKNAQILN